MKNILLGFFVFSLVSMAQAQVAATISGDDSASKTRTNDELNKESSSFIGDPDPLDPLPVKDESIKEDDEPVLEDIRDVIDKDINVPDKKKSRKVKNGKGAGKSKSANGAAADVSADEALTRSADEPDLRLEKRLNDVYNRVNSKPTSAAAWTAAAAGRKAEVYIVQKGDTLWTISKTLFGDTNFWPKIWAINRQGITNPHQITPGLKILFFPGTADDLPTLAVGDEGYQSPEDLVEVEDPNQPGSKTVLSRKSTPNAIPQSLPLYRNDEYFLAVPDVKVELDTLPVPKNFYTNDIILSEIVVSSEVKFGISSVSNEPCRANLLIKDVKFKRQPMGGYTILEPMDAVKNKDGSIYPYRIIGSAVGVDSETLRVTRCDSVMSTDIIIIQSSLLPKVRMQRASQIQDATLIGGPDVESQQLFTFQQVAYIDLGQQNIQPGQILPIRSKVTDSVHGEVQIIDRFGSYAIGVIISVEDTITEGDTLLVK